MTDAGVQMLRQAVCRNARYVPTERRACERALALWSLISYKELEQFLFPRRPIPCAELSGEQSFRIERHGEIAIVIPTPKVEEMHEALIDQAARMVVTSLHEDPPSGIVIDLSQVNYFGSVFVSFLLRAIARPRNWAARSSWPGPPNRPANCCTCSTWKRSGPSTTRKEAINALTSD